MEDYETETLLGGMKRKLRNGLKHGSRHSPVPISLHNLGFCSVFRELKVIEALELFPQ